MGNPVTVFHVINHEGDEVIFLTETLQKKQSSHPELSRKKFLARLQETISNPDEVWEDYGNPKQRQCYYRKYSATSYVKAVVWIGSEPHKVITAY